MLKDPTDSIKVLKEIKSTRRPMSVKLWYNLNKNRPTVVRFVTKSPNDNVSPKTLVFSDVEMLQKVEGYHPPHNFLQLPPFWHSESSDKPYITVAAIGRSYYYT